MVLTLALAFGTRRMLDRRSLVRSLPVVEIVGAADLICTDKTGTITEGRMSLRRLAWQGRMLDVTGSGGGTERRASWTRGSPTDQHANRALLAGAACNNAHRAPDGSFRGDPTEVALLVGAMKAGVDLEPFERVEEIPFSSERKRMSVIVDGGARAADARQGSARGRSSPAAPQIDAPDGIRRMTDDDRRWIDDANERLAGGALRVLALAGRGGRPRRPR